MNCKEKEAERLKKHRQAQRNYMKKNPLQFHIAQIKWHNKKIEELLQDGETLNQREEVNNE